MPCWNSYIFKVFNYTLTCRAVTAAFILDYTGKCQVGAAKLYLTIPGCSGSEQLHLYSTIPGRSGLERQHIYSITHQHAGLEGWSSKIILDYTWTFRVGAAKLYSTIPGRSGLKQQNYTRLYLDLPGWSSCIFKVFNYTLTCRAGTAAFILDYTWKCQIGAADLHSTIPGSAGLEQQTYTRLYLDIRIGAAAFILDYT